MKDKLMSYVDLLFAGTQDTQDIRQEILQNTLDRYDDLIAQGKTPEAAYQLSIAGIGDISQLLTHQPPQVPAEPQKQDDSRHKLLRSIAIAMYILCPVPLFLEGDTLGLCGLLLMVAIATAILIYTGKKSPVTAPAPKPRKGQHIHGIVWLLGAALYLLISFLTGAWYITWLMFLIISACNGLLSAIMDLKEAK